MYIPYINIGHFFFLFLENTKTLNRTYCQCEILLRSFVPFKLIFNSIYDDGYRRGNNDNLRSLTFSE